MPLGMATELQPFLRPIWETTTRLTLYSVMNALGWSVHVDKTTPGNQEVDRSHVTTAIWWPLGVAVVSVTCMRVRWVSHTWKYTQWNIFLFESSHKSPLSTNPYHMGFRYEASLNLYTYSGQCPNDTYILLHIPLHVCPNYPHTGLTTATAPSGHQVAVVTWNRSIGAGRPPRNKSLTRDWAVHFSEFSSTTSLYMLFVIVTVSTSITDTMYRPQFHPFPWNEYLSG